MNIGLCDESLSRGIFGNGVNNAGCGESRNARQFSE
jgi:hypothetical protein